MSTTCNCIHKRKWVGYYKGNIEFLRYSVGTSVLETLDFFLL